MKTLQLRLTDQEHMNIKLMATKRGTTMKDFVLENIRGGESDNSEPGTKSRQDEARAYPEVPTPKVIRDNTEPLMIRRAGESDVRKFKYLPKVQPGKGKAK